MSRNIFYFVFFLILTSCSKGNDKPNAYVLRFNPDKCFCCWGWDIAIGNDTIRTDNAIVGELVGHEITNKIPVYIKLGEKQNNCGESAPGRYNYYDVLEIEIIDSD